MCIRGIFSASQIARQLGVPLQITELARTFAEIEEALAVANRGEGDQARCVRARASCRERDQCVPTANDCFYATCVIADNGGEACAAHCVNQRSNNDRGSNMQRKCLFTRRWPHASRVPNNVRRAAAPASSAATYSGCGLSSRVHTESDRFLPG